MTTSSGTPIPPTMSNNSNNKTKTTTAAGSTLTPRVLSRPQSAAASPLHPNVTTRSPRTPGRRDDLVGQAPRSPHIEMTRRTVGGAGSAVGGQNGYVAPRIPRSTPTVGAGRGSAAGTTPKFFHASEIGIKKDDSKERASSAGAGKFFLADSRRAESPLPGSGPKVASATLAAPAMEREPSLPTPTRNVRFVYANGVEEELVRPKAATIARSDSSSASTNLSPNLILSPQRIQFPANTLSTPALLRTSSQHSPKSTPSSRRSSMEVKPRHGRTLSTTGADLAGLLPTPESNDLLTPQSLPTPTLSTPSISTPPATEESAASKARRDRKLLDLEIYNTSLLAYNKTLERNLKKQALEIRRLRRERQAAIVAGIVPPSRRKRSASTSKTSGAETEPELVIEEPLAELSSSSDEDDDISPPPSPRGSDAPTATLTATESDLRKHRALVEASRKLDASLTRCQLVSERLIEEGKKALGYTVDPGAIGGRVVDGVVLGGDAVGSGSEREDEEDGEDGDEGSETETEAEFDHGDDGNDDGDRWGDTADENETGDESNLSYSHSELSEMSGLSSGEAEELLKDLEGLEYSTDGD